LANNFLESKSEPVKEKPPMEYRGYEPPNVTNPYEQIVKVYAAVFSVLVGISLKDLLDPLHFGSEAQQPALAEEYGPALAFTATLFLVIRFLVGSANHLWIESLEHASLNKIGQSAAWTFIGHFLGLTLFGFLILRLCRCTGATEIVGWSALFLLAAGATAGLFRLLSPQIPYFNMWRRWFWLDATQGAALGALWYWYAGAAIYLPYLKVRCNFSLLAMAAISLIGLVLDLHFQIRKLEQIAKPPKQIENIPRKLSPEESAKLQTRLVELFTRLPQPPAK
jgi:hypothetical protein